jgi:hypothetical protein
MTNAEALALFQEQVKNYSSNIISPSLARHWMDEGQIDIVRKTGCVTTDATVNVTASTREYDLPTDVLKIKHIKYYDGTTYTKLEGTTEDALEEGTDYPNETATDPPRYYYIKQAGTPTIGLSPKPKTTTSNAIQVHYVQRPATLTTTTNDPAIPEPYQRLIVTYALYRCLEKDVKNETADRYHNQYLHDVADMKTQLINWDKKRRPAMVAYDRSHKQRTPLRYDN